MIIVNLINQEGLDTDLQVIQQINFVGNLDEDGDITIFFIFGEVKKRL